jgi:hypothetical protein
VTVHVNELENGRLVRFWKRTDHWCAFSWSICDETTTLLGVLRATVSNVTSAYTNHRKKISAKRNSGWEPTLTEINHHTLSRIINKIKTEPLQQVTAVVTIQTVSTKTVRREFHKSNIHGRAAIAKPLITESNAEMRKRRYHDHKTWTSDTGKQRVISSDESSLTSFPTSGRVYVWRTPKEDYNPQRLVPTVKHGRFCDGLGSNIMVQYSVGPIITLHTWITAREYMNRLDNQVHPMIQALFLNNNAVFQDDNVPIHTDWSVLSWVEEHEGEQHLPWTA